MNQAQLIGEMLKVAAPVVQSYWTDLGHDARLLAKAEPGAVFLWAPRESGSFIVTLRRGITVNRDAHLSWDAFNSSSSTLQWYSLRVGAGDECSLSPVPTEEAAVWVDAMKRQARNDMPSFAETNM